MADEQEDLDQDKLAAEWAAAAEAEQPDDPMPDAAADPAMGAARVLNQNEIDSLLGFGDGAGSNSDNSGIRAIIDFGARLL